MFPEMRGQNYLKDKNVIFKGVTANGIYTYQCLLKILYTTQINKSLRTVKSTPSSFLEVFVKAHVQYTNVVYGG